ncbi:hypothetical protein AGRA3207_004374 [Actinomadura graeca]|uniref:Uncharacterized protein n=1 Tax=Actinomadura graeca TaxID=2750812 RepID=A0ABX8QWM4_9ACTN|nr:hypothetical protein [Actinomadura graeca]QXJ23241.1 hypothetical protein AGRA3207_004374 [Actinomadura graeca]
MNGARKVVYLGLGVTVFWSGAYVVIYLARWEWQRALMAGELLLVGLVVLLAVLGARRLARMEQRLAELIEGTARPAEPPARPTAVGPTAHATAPAGEAPRFRWLEPDGDAYRVFIPVLLGAGLAVSGLAALVERLATALGRGGRAGPAGRVRLPDALTPPAGGVLAGAADLAPPRPDRTAWLRAAALALALLLVTALVVDELAERTQDRPDRPVAAAASTVVIEAATRGDTGAATVEPLVARLWEYCRGSTRPYVEGGGAVALGGGRFALVVRPALGEHALRRLRGCLQDAMIDRARFRVVSADPAPR